MTGIYSCAIVFNRKWLRVESGECTILVLNLVLALGFGRPLAGRFARLAGKDSARIRDLALLLSVCLQESEWPLVITTAIATRRSSP